MPNEIPPEITIKDVEDTLSSTIKGDNTNKCLLFLAMLSTYTENSQMNIMFNSQSSTGKTYLTQEVAKYFPDEDKIVYGGATSTALFYGKTAYDPKRKVKLIDFERKILIFLDQPDSYLQSKIRPVLSHDDKEITFCRTNRNRTGENRAENIVIRGFPTTVFCSASNRYDEQEATRALLLSPEISEAKIELAVDTQLLKSSNPNYERNVLSQEKRLSLIERIKKIKAEGVIDIVIEDIDYVKELFQSEVGRLSKPRYMRDIQHFIQIIKAVTLLNIWHRKTGEKTYCASKEDIDAAFNLWKKIAKTQGLNISPFLYDFYNKYILEAYNRLPDSAKRYGISKGEILKYYFEINGTFFQESYLQKDILLPLNTAGLITFSTHPDDRRQRLVLPIRRE